MENPFCVCDFKLHNRDNPIKKTHFLVFYYEKSDLLSDLKLHKYDNPLKTRFFEYFEMENPI